MDDRKRHKANTLAANSIEHRTSGGRGNALAAVRSGHVVRGNGVVVVAFDRGEPARKTDVSGSAGSRDATSRSWPPGAAPCEPPPSIVHKRGSA